MSEPLDWSYRTTEIPEAGLRQSRTATEAERAKVASMLEIVSCEQLSSEFVIRAIGQGHYRLAGKVAAQLTQNCVVTLDPLAQAVEGTFDVEFWPAGKQPAERRGRGRSVERRRDRADRARHDRRRPHRFRDAVGRRSIPIRAKRGPNSRPTTPAMPPNGR